MGRTSDLTESQVAVLKWLSVNGIKQVEIAAELGICQSAVSKCLRIWAAIGKTVAGKGLPRREMTASWPDWLRRSGFTAPSDWLGCGRRLEWRHLTEQHMEGCMNRVSAAVYQL